MISEGQRIRERAPNFLRNTRLNAGAMRDALVRGDLETIISIGHRMSGAGGMFGFQRITELGAAIELAAGDGKIEAIPNLMQELSSYLDLVTPYPKATKLNPKQSNPVEV